MATQSSRRSGLTFWQLAEAYYQLCGPARRLIPLQLFLVFLDAVLQASVPALTGYVVDRVMHDPHGFVKHQLPWLAPAVVAAALLLYGIAYTQHYMAQYIGNSAGVNAMVELYNHLQRLSADFYQRTHVGEITSRLTNDINQGVMPLYTHTISITWSISMIAVACGWILFISPRLILVFATTIVIMLIATQSLRNHIKHLNREVRDETGRINARITEDVSVNSLIRVFAREQVFSERIRQHSAVFLTKVLRTAKVTTIFSDVLNIFMGILAPAGMLLAGAVIVAQGGISIGALVTMMQSWQRTSGPISYILNALTAFYASLASMDRIFEFFHEPLLVKDHPDARRLQVTTGTITMRDVTFSYPADAEHIVLAGLSLDVPAKHSLALVGESGAGKSTIVQLLMRFYDPQQGQILIDGQDLRAVTQASLREQIGFVMQETVLLSGSVRENLVLAKPGASTQEIIAALKRAAAWDFVKALPQGLETMLGERGARLSGGQKQRLSIARIFLKNPPIVIFDEATSALDTITERQILETMQELFKGRTVITIAHRLSTVIDCDEIVLLDHGHIFAKGPHAELLQTCPRYQELCQKQLVVAPGAEV